MIEPEEFFACSVAPALVMMIRGDLPKKDIGGLIISSALAAGAFGLASKNPIYGAAVAMISGTIFVMRRQLSEEDD